MAKRGPRANTPRRHKRQPQLAPAATAPPKVLSPRAREEWRRLAPALRELGLLTVGDVAIMVSYCETYAEIVELTELMQTLDSLMDRVEIYRQRAGAMTRLNALTRKLGLDPRARTNLAPPPAPEPEGAEFDEFADGEA